MEFRALSPKERLYWVQQQESAVLLFSRHLYPMFINFFLQIYLPSLLPSTNKDSMVFSAMKRCKEIISSAR